MSQPEQQGAASAEARQEVPLWAVAPPAPDRGVRERWVHALLEGLANSMVQKAAPEKLRFGLVRTPEELAAVGRMRLRVYRAKLPYLVQELSGDGMDRYDANSYVFAVWRGEQVVATLRANRSPFETLRYVSEPELAGWLKEGWDTDYLEWGRLVVDSCEGLNRLTPALVAYAGVYTLLLLGYRKGFAYARKQARQSFGGYRTEQEELSFTIPHRGEHVYALIKADYVKASLFSLPRWLGTVVLRVLRGPRRKSESVLPESVK